jgi:nucleotide-binding universal stress UspA family protein
MEDYVKSSGADMAVMASRALSNETLQNSTILGSVTLAAVKAITVPLLIINSNCISTMEAIKREFWRKN